MNVNGKNYQTVWAEDDAEECIEKRNRLTIQMIDQRELPHEFVVTTIKHSHHMADAIRDMVIRGAPAIGAAGAYGMAQVYAEAYLYRPLLQVHADELPTALARQHALAVKRGYESLRASRPTAQDLFARLDEVRAAADAVGAENYAGLTNRENSHESRWDMLGAHGKEKALAALRAAKAIANESADRCRRIGEHGAPLLEGSKRVMTHCNAGWLACVDWGTALSVIYAAHRRGYAPRVLASETRPRLQGANLTAWELGQEGVAYEVFADSASGHLIRSAEVDLIVTGADRVAANGDAANKIGTYEKALLAREHGVPFYIAAPASTFDLDCQSGASIPIEERSADELFYAYGRDDDGKMGRVRIAPEGAAGRNPAFDVTPAELITGIITEFGIVKPNREAITKALGAQKV